MALPCLYREDDFRLPYIIITKNALVYEYFIDAAETRQCHCLYEKSYNPIIKIQNLRESTE